MFFLLSDRFIYRFLAYFVYLLRIVDYHPKIVDYALCIGMAINIGDKLRLDFICQAFVINFSKAFNLLPLLMFVAFAPRSHQKANIQLLVYFSQRSHLTKCDRAIPNKSQKSTVHRCLHPFGHKPKRWG